MRLEWGTVPNAASYTVKRGMAIGSETVLAAGVMTTSFADGSTVKGRRYFYTVTAVNGLGESVASYEASITAVVRSTAISTATARPTSRCIDR